MEVKFHFKCFQLIFSEKGVIKSYKKLNNFFVNQRIQRKSMPLKSLFFNLSVVVYEIYRLKILINAQNRCVEN